MSVKWLSVIILILVIIISAVFLNLSHKKSLSNFTVPETIKSPTLTPSPSSQPSPREVYIGAWVTDFWDNDTKTLKTKNLKDFENKLDKKFALANIYSEWAYLKDPKLINKLDEISQNGWAPLISSNPYFFKDCPDKGENLYKTVGSGKCDAFLKDAVNNMKSFNKPIFFRFAWEMNLPSMYWSTQKTKSAPADFITAWRKFYKISKEQEADNIIWVLSFNTTNSVTTPFKELFPGNEYVDWVAIDGYNWGNTHPWAGWASFNGTFKASYQELAALTNKPVMISEVNSAPTGTGGDKALWLKDMLDVQIPQEFPNIKAVILFNEDKSEGEKIDWRMEKSPEYINALKESFKNPIYKSAYP